MIRKDLYLKLNSAIKSKWIAELIQKASNFKSSVWIEKDEKKANAKSMLGILALEIADGSVISIIADGEDEDLAVSELKEFVEANA